MKTLYELLRDMKYLKADVEMATRDGNVFYSGDLKDMIDTLESLAGKLKKLL